MWYICINNFIIIMPRQKTYLNGELSEEATLSGVDSSGVSRNFTGEELISYVEEESQLFQSQIIAGEEYPKWEIETHDTQEDVNDYLYEHVAMQNYSNDFSGTQVFRDDVSFYDDNGVLIMKYDATKRTFVWSGELSTAEGYVRLNGNFPLYLGNDEDDVRFGNPDTSYVTLGTKLSAKASLNGDATEDFASDSISATDITFATSGSPEIPAETGVLIKEEISGNTSLSLGTLSGLYTIVFMTSATSNGYGMIYESILVDIDNSELKSYGLSHPAGSSVSYGGSDPGTGSYWFYIDSGVLKLRTPLGSATSGINVKTQPTYYTF